MLLFKNHFCLGLLNLKPFFSLNFFFSTSKKHIRGIKCYSYSTIAINPNQSLLLVWPQDEDILQEKWRSILGSGTLLLKTVLRADFSWLRTDILKQHSLEAHRRIKYASFLVLFSNSTRDLLFSKLTFLLHRQSILKITMNFSEDKDYM